MRRWLGVIALCVSCGGRTIGSIGDEAVASPCSIPVETVLLPASGNIGGLRALRASGDYLYVLGYVVEKRLHHLVRIHKRTGALDRQPLGPTVTHLAIGSTHAYWADAKAGLALLPLPLQTPSASSPLLVTVSGELQALQVAPDDTLFWTTTVRGGVLGGAYELAPNATEPKQRGTGDHRALFVDGRDIFAASQRGERAWISRMPRNDDISIARDVGRFVGDLLADGDDVFIAMTDTILRMPRNVTEPVELATGQTSPVAIAVDATHVYFADAGSYHDDLPPPKPADVPGSIRRVPRAGGPVEVLAVEGREVSSIAVDACAVYWISERGLVRRAK